MHLIYYVSALGDRTSEHRRLHKFSIDMTGGDNWRFVHGVVRNSGS